MRDLDVNELVDRLDEIIEAMQGALRLLAERELKDLDRLASSPASEELLRQVRERGDDNG